jgi:hypothetical protein
MAKTRILAGVTLFLAIGVTAASVAVAGEPSRWQRTVPPHEQPLPRHVVAESRFGHGTVSGPVRLSPNGYEVRLPGGTWIACRRSCSETLRVESLDFWENRGAGGGAIDNECGVFGCLSRSFHF